MKKVISFVLGCCLLSTTGFATEANFATGMEAGLIVSYVTELLSATAISDQPVVSGNCSDVQSFPIKQDEVDCSKFEKALNSQITCDEVKAIVNQIVGRTCTINQTESAITITLSDISQDLDKMLSDITANQGMLTYNKGVFVLNLGAFDEESN